MALIVNGERVKDSAIEREAALLRPRYEEVFAEQPQTEREAQLMEWSRENVIERVLINQAAKEHGEEIPAAEVESALGRLKETYKDHERLYKDFDAEGDEDLKAQIELQLRVERKLAEVCKDIGEPRDSAVREYYERNQAEFTSGEQVRVAHIVKYVNWQTDEAAAYGAIQQPLQELKDGASFEIVVDRHTDCADSGGDLGYVMRGQLVEEFEDVVFNLGVGQVSDIFRSRFGFHIAKVYDKKAPTVAELQEVKGRIVDILKEEMRDNAVNQFIDGLKEKATIEEA